MVEQEALELGTGHRDGDTLGYFDRKVGFDAEGEVGVRAAGVVGAGDGARGSRTY